MKQAQDELQRLLGVEQSQDQKPATDPRFANALAEEHGVTELAPTDHQDSVTLKLAKLAELVGGLPESRRVAVVLGGVAEMLNAARAEGPGIVAHLASAMNQEAVDLIVALQKAETK